MSLCQNSKQVFGPSLRVLPVRPAVRLSVCLSICPVRVVTRKQKKWKIETGRPKNVPQDASKWIANFHLKRSKVKPFKVKVTGRQKPTEIAAYPAYIGLFV